MLSTEGKKDGSKSEVKKVLRNFDKTCRYNLFSEKKILKII